MSWAADILSRQFGNQIRNHPLRQDHMAGQGFRCLYINLDRSLDRREQIEAEIAKAGVIAERVPGFDGKRDIGKLPTTYSPTRRAFVGKQLNAAEIGCVESHRRALRMLVEAGDAFGVVLEDDVELLDGFRGAVEALIAETAGWHIIRLEWRKRGVLADPRVSISTGHKVFVPKNMTFGAAAFLYSVEGARHALKALDGGYFQTPDAELGSRAGSAFRILQLDPPVAREKPLESLLGNKPEYVGGSDRESSERNRLQVIGNGLYRLRISLRRRGSAKPNAKRLARETDRLRKAGGAGEMSGG
ncbi:MAG: glycosyltransferase family 25 protein [Alphaproteobacteria bacterium]|nr:MAG: glycosyltransferase family 25 protein [Alphaproteobacteria bacterium]